MAMETLQAIKTRRSIRKFLDKPVPVEVIRDLLEAAMFAPSAGNEQPWQFIVLDERSLLDAVPRICPTASMCRHSPVAILVCSDSSLEKYPGFWVQDCSAAVENMLLAAHALGLGAVWAGIYPLKERIGDFKALLSLPEEITPFALVALGYPDELPAAPQRYRRDRVHQNGW
jgi:nitroreductase